MVFDLVLSFFNSDKKYCITGLTSLRFSRRQKASRNVCAPSGDSKSKSSGDSSEASSFCLPSRCPGAFAFEDELALAGAAKIGPCSPSAGWSDEVPFKVLRGVEGAAAAGFGAGVEGAGVPGAGVHGARAAVELLFGQH